MDDFIFKSSPEYVDMCVSEILQKGMSLENQVSSGKLDLSDLSLSELCYYFGYLGYCLGVDAMLQSMKETE